MIKVHQSSNKPPRFPEKPKTPYFDQNQQLCNLIVQGKMELIRQFFAARPSTDLNSLIKFNGKMLSLWQLPIYRGHIGITEIMFMHIEIQNRHNAIQILLNFMNCAIDFDQPEIFDYLLNISLKDPYRKIPSSVYASLLEQAKISSHKDQTIIDYLKFRLAGIKPSKMTYQKKQYDLYPLLSRADNNKISFRAISLANLRYSTNQERAEIIAKDPLRKDDFPEDPFKIVPLLNDVFRHHKMMILLGYQSIYEALSIETHSEKPTINSLYSMFYSKKPDHEIPQLERYTLENLSKYTTKELHLKVLELTKTRSHSGQPIPLETKAAMLSKGFVEGRMDKNLLLSIIYVLQQKLTPLTVPQLPFANDFNDGNLCLLHLWIHNRGLFTVIKEDLFDTPKLERLNLKELRSADNKNVYYDLFERFSDWDSQDEFLPIVCQLRKSKTPNLQQKSICLDYEHDYPENEPVWAIKKALEPFMGLWDDLCPNPLQSFEDSSGIKPK